MFEKSWKQSRFWRGGCPLRPLKRPWTSQLRWKTPWLWFVLIWTDCWRRAYLCRWAPLRKWLFVWQLRALRAIGHFWLLLPTLTDTSAVHQNMAWLAVVRYDMVYAIFALLACLALRSMTTAWAHHGSKPCTLQRPNVHGRWSRVGLCSRRFHTSSHSVLGLTYSMAGTSVLEDTLWQAAWWCSWVLKKLPMGKLVSMPG